MLNNINRADKRKHKAMFKQEIGTMLIENGFEFKKNVYFRQHGDELVQMMSYGYKDGIFFDIIPLYSYWNHQAMECLDFDELVTRSVSLEFGGSTSFDNELECAKSIITDVFKKVSNAKELIFYNNEWGKLMRQYEEDDEDDEDICAEEEQYDKDLQRYMIKAYPFLAQNGEDIVYADSLYAVIRNNEYDRAYESIRYAYFERLAMEEFDKLIGNIDGDELEERIAFVNDIYRNELKIMKYYEKEDFSSIQHNLNENVHKNKDFLKRHFGIKL